MMQGIGIDVIIRLADRLTAPLRDLNDRAGVAGRQMNDSLKLTAGLNADQLSSRLSAAGWMVCSYASPSGWNWMPPPATPCGRG